MKQRFLRFSDKGAGQFWIALFFLQTILILHLEKVIRWCIITAHASACLQHRFMGEEGILCQRIVAAAVHQAAAERAVRDVPAARRETELERSR